MHEQSLEQVGGELAVHAPVGQDVLVDAVLHDLQGGLGWEMAVQVCLLHGGECENTDGLVGMGVLL